MRQTINILNKANRALAPVFGTTAAVPKREKFSWATPGDPGQFELIPKDNLNIDGSYQRDQTSAEKVKDIAREWDWKLFGTLAVVRRLDGSLWVYDGGHRTRAAFLRDDITELPCMVFDVADKKEEAMAFLGANTMVSNVRAFDKHRAAVVAAEPKALAVQKLLEKYGYTAVKGGDHRGAFCAINTLRDLLTKDAVLAERVFAACVRIAVDKEPIPACVLRGLACCQRKLDGKADILSGEHLSKLIDEGFKSIVTALNREKHILGKGGELVEAKAILDLLNKGRKRRLAFA